MLRAWVSKASCTPTNAFAAWPDQPPSIVSTSVRSVWIRPCTCPWASSTAVAPRCIASCSTPNAPVTLSLASVGHVRAPPLGTHLRPTSYRISTGFATSCKVYGCAAYFQDLRAGNRQPRRVGIQGRPRWDEQQQIVRQSHRRDRVVAQAVERQRRRGELAAGRGDNEAGGGLRIVRPGQRGLLGRHPDLVGEALLGLRRVVDTGAVRWSRSRRCGQHERRVLPELNADAPGLRRRIGKLGQPAAGQV